MLHIILLQLRNSYNIRGSHKNHSCKLVMLCDKGLMGPVNKSVF